jgi:hypothetical protein
MSRIVEHSQRPLTVAELEALILEWKPVALSYESEADFAEWAVNYAGVGLLRRGFRDVFPFRLETWRSAVDRYQFRRCMARYWPHGVN